MDGVLSMVAGRADGRHQWKFFRVGGVDQVVLRSAADIINLDQLDQKLWVALACPARLLEFDTRTLELLDTDKDGRIRAPEIIEVTRWVKEVFKNPDDLLKGGDSVELTAINDATPTGKALLTAARRILGNIGKESATAITLADVSDTARIFAATEYNGDGIVPPQTTPDESVQKAIEDVIATHGSLADRSGAFGINQAKVDAFFTETEALLEWDRKAAQDQAVCPLGANTKDGAEALAVVRQKIDDFFMRCRLAAFDSRATAALNFTEAEFVALGAQNLSANVEKVAGLPLAKAAAGRPLPLREGLNPAWEDQMAAFTAQTVTPILDPEISMLTEEDWRKLKEKFAPYFAWLAFKPAAAAEKLGIPRLQELVSSGMRQKLTELIQEDLAFQVASEQIISLEKLVRVQRDLFRLLNNFVSFADFYDRRGAIFQAGTLFLDGRSCELCVHVGDSAKHAALAGLARAYLAYCECTRPGGEKATIAAAFTAGDSEHLMVGRNGLFYDRKGRDWDATITRIIDNPISLRQAFFAPYKKFVRLIEEQVAKRASAAESAAQMKLGEVATHVAGLDLAAAKPGTPQKKIDVGTVAALGVALGSFTTFLGVMLTKFIDLRWWAPLAFIGIMLAISGPSVIIAWIKLRERNLGPILDANGWAVNGRMKINVPFGGALSKTAKLPPGAELHVADPFSEKHNARNISICVAILLLFLALAWRFDLLNAMLPPQLQHQPILSTNIITTNIIVNTAVPTNNPATANPPAQR